MEAILQLSQILQNRKRRFLTATATTRQPAVVTARPSQLTPPLTKRYFFSKYSQTLILKLKTHNYIFILFIIKYEIYNKQFVYKITQILFSMMYNHELNMIFSKKNSKYFLKEDFKLANLMSPAGLI